VDAVGGNDPGLNGLGQNRLAHDQNQEKTRSNTQ
jgi:hypothetical protein